MKRFLCITVALLMLVGCGKKSENGIIKELEKKIDKILANSFKGDVL